MFEKTRSLLLRSTASARSHNLAVVFWQGHFRAAVIHKATVNIVIWSESGGIHKTYELHCKDNAGSRNDVYQVKWCFINQILVLTVLSRIGLQIYDDTGREMYLWYHFDKVGWSGRSLHSVNDDQLAIGTNDGKIMLFHLGPRCSDAVLVDGLQTGFKAAVTVLASSPSYLGCGNNDGCVIVWQSKSPYQKLQCFEYRGTPCTGICIWQNSAVAAYGCGHIRLFDITSGNVLAEITAHAKWISALHIAQSSGLILSVSEDSFLRVWQLNESLESVVSLKFSEHISDTMLCGGAFLDNRGNSFAVTGFECEEIMCYSM